MIHVFNKKGIVVAWIYQPYPRDNPKDWIITFAKKKKDIETTLYRAKQIAELEFPGCKFKKEK